MDSRKKLMEKIKRTGREGRGRKGRRMNGRKKSVGESGTEGE